MTVLLVLSFAGFYLAFRTYVKDNPAVFPVLFIAGSSVISYVFGLAGLLKLGAYIVIVIGITLIPVSIVKQIETGNKNIL